MSSNKEKNKKDIMHVKERYLKSGQLALEMHCSGKDPLTRESKVYVHTERVPTNLKGKKEIEAFRLKAQFDWKDEVQKLSLGTAVQKNNIFFIDFATDYVENVIKAKSPNYYRTYKDHLETAKAKLGNYLLSEMSPTVIQTFCDWLCKRTYKKTTCTVKVSLKDFIKKERKLTLTDVANGCSIAQTTLKAALMVGSNISKETATKLCDFLNVPLDQYFAISTENVPYSYSANNGLKVFIHAILQEALRLRLIEHNYASKEYVRPVTGTKGEKRFLDKTEMLRFINCLKTEPDLRKKAAFACYAYIGTRNSEVVGLSWADIDFEKKEMSIVHNTMYVKGFGIITKDPKSQKSKRVISMPSALADILAEYKVWWDKEKIKHGDLWTNTDKLFVQNCGKDMSGLTLADWLKDWLKKNGLKEVTPHELRHSNITLAVAEGVDIKTVSARAGHSDVQTTLNIYTHYSKEADKQAADKINELLSI